MFRFVLLSLIMTMQGLHVWKFVTLYFYWPTMIVPRTMRLAVLLTCVTTSAAFSQTETIFQTSDKNDILEKWGIESTSEGITRYLKNIVPGSDAQKQIRIWIEQLYDRRFSVRRRAANSLIASPVVPQSLLEEVAESKVLEVRKRVNDILKRRGNTPRLIPIGVFHAVRKGRITIAVSDLFNVLPHFPEQYLRHDIRKTILSVARPDDVPMFFAALSNPQSEIRIVAMQALGKLNHHDSRTRITSLLADPKTTDREKIHLVRALIDFGDQNKLNNLVELLESEDLRVRIHASVTLTDIAGDTMGYAPYDLVEKRTSAVERWKAWAGLNAETIKLNLPLALIERDVGHLNGNTLLAFGYKNKVVEYDSSGHEVWQFKIRGAWSAEKLKNGNVLITAYNLDKVVEVDHGGKTIWEYALRGCLNARKLRNDNLLLVSSSDRKVVEVEPIKNSLVWKYETNKNCRDAYRLANGNTLVASGNKLEEVTPEGKISWSYNDKTQPFGIHPLANGNILIADFGVSLPKAVQGPGRIIEIDRNQKIVWQYSDSRDGNRFRACDVYRLPNGNTMITTENRFLEVDTNGHRLWEKQGTRFGSARR